MIGLQYRILGVIALVLCHLGCRSGSERIWKDSNIVMGTIVEITVVHRSEEIARSAISAGFAELQRIDELTSSFKPKSVISRLNKEGASAKVPVGEEVFEIIEEALEISRASKGAFDVTIWPISSLWEFDRGGKLPDAKQYLKNLASVGYANLELDASKRQVGFRLPGMALDLGGIAKGWAIDRAMERIIAGGIGSAIVDAGGDLRVVGTRPGKDFWRIGVQHPRDSGALIFTFNLKDTAIVTSGDYERYFIMDGIRYHHIIDPATGQPARGCRSVTVLAPTAAEADACATAAFVLGPSRGIAFLRARPGVRGVIVAADGALSWTDEALAQMAIR